jgi:peptide/nickel transport system permease protein
VSSYVVRRLLSLVFTLFIISMVNFVLITLPPGDFLSTYVMQLSQSGQEIDESVLASLEKRFGLDQPIYIQYLKWITAFLRGDLGLSFEWNRPVSELIWSRLQFTMLISLCSLAFTYAVAIPIGIYSATHQYSFFDYFFTGVGFLGLATPNFLLALVLMYAFYSLFGMSVGGLFSPDMVDAPWSLMKLVDLINHLWIPVIVIGTAGTCGLIRVMRSCLLDELGKQYVTTARSKGLAEGRLLFKYPVRVAVNPIVSTVGWILPQIISGSAITSIVLSLPTTGPLLLQALLSQDMYLAGSFLFILATLTVVGTVLSDVLLAVLDPRIRFTGRRE